MENTNQKTGTIASMFAWNDIKAGGKFIGDMWNVVSPFRRRESRNESFDQAVRRVGADSQSLAANRNVFIAISAINSAVAVGGAIAAISKFASGQSGGFAFIGLVAVSSSFALTYAFRAWQIREKRLASFGEFLKGWR